MRKIKMSFNPHFHDGETKHKQYYQSGFQPVEFSLDEIAEAIKDGFAFSYQFKDGIRRAENFLATDYLAVDIDHGMTISDAEQHPIVQQHCSLIYTTRSHTPELHRFRLFFALTRTLTKASEVTAASRTLTQRLGGDRKTTDAGRMFFGSSSSDPLIFPRQISEEFLNELIRDGKRTPSSESTSFAGSTANRSEHRPDLNLMVVNQYGISVSLASIKKTTTIHCPFHDDHNPSAFVSQSRNGSKYIHCSSCQKTWYVKGTLPYEVNFTEFEELLLTVKNRVKKGLPSLDPLLDLTSISPACIKIFTTEYLSLRGIDPGITLIKSPKGTGKTTYLADSLEKILTPFATLEEYEETVDSETEASFVGTERILLIGHRRALIGEMCSRLKLNNYLNDPKNEPLRMRKQRYGVCLDSLDKVRHERPYDIVLIDEVEQVLSHFISDTIGEKREGLFLIFANILRNAKKIVALDADLGWVTYATLTYLTRNITTPRKRKKVNGKRPPPPPNDIRIFLNKWKTSGKELQVYSSAFQLIHAMKEYVIEGKRIFVTSNSKEKIKSLTKAVHSLEKDLGKKIPLISITSENSQTKEVQQFIQNVRTEFLNYQVVLASPSLGTGIDITFDNGASEVDAVFGIFENQINTHFEIDQQLARVRNPKSVHVWVCPRTFEFETDFRVAAKDFLHRHLKDSFVEGFLSEDVLTPSSIPESFVTMTAMIVSQQRASKNRLRRNFLTYRQSQGWTLQFVQDDAQMVDSGKGLFNIGKELSSKEWQAGVLNAHVMDRVDFLRFDALLESGESGYAQDEWNSYYRTKLELFYREVASEALLEADDRGKQRKQIRMFESLIAMDDQKYRMVNKQPTDPKEGRILKLRQNVLHDRWFAILLLYGLLSTTPVFEYGRFMGGTKFTMEALNKFIKQSKRVKGVIATQLDLAPPLDLDEKPVTFLNKVLALVGMKALKAGQSNLNGHRSYHYVLDAYKLASMTRYAKVRSDKDHGGWDFVNKLHGFKYSPLEMEIIESSQSGSFP